MRGCKTLQVYGFPVETLARWCLIYRAIPGVVFRKYGKGRHVGLYNNALDCHVAYTVDWEIFYR